MPKIMSSFKRSEFFSLEKTHGFFNMLFCKKAFVKQNGYILNLQIACNSETVLQNQNDFANRQRRVPRENATVDHQPRSVD